MATIKIQMRRELITVDNERGRKIKIMRFGDLQGRGKEDQNSDIDLSENGVGWSGKLKLIEWVEIGKDPVAKKFRMIYRKKDMGAPYGIQRVVCEVPLNYKLEEGEEEI